MSAVGFASRTAETADAESSILGAFAVALAEGAAVFGAALALVLGLFGHTENGEFALYLLAIAGALPLAFVSVTWRRRSLTANELSALGTIDAVSSETSCRQRRPPPRPVGDPRPGSKILVADATRKGVRVFCV